MNVSPVVLTLLREPTRDEVKIPVVVVFMKYDLLVAEHERIAEENNLDLTSEELEEKINRDFDQNVEQFRSYAGRDVAYVKVSTKSGWFL